MIILESKTVSRYLTESAAETAVSYHHMRNADLGCLMPPADHQHLIFVAVALEEVGTKQDPQLLHAALDPSYCTVHQLLNRLNEQVKLGIVSIE